MNENLNLAEILKDCPKGTKLYSTALGEVELRYVEDNTNYPIAVRINEISTDRFTADGKLFGELDGECLLFPSKDQRDWSCMFFSHIVKDEETYPYACGYDWFAQCIPYNDDTKHLVGTTDEAPKFYRYWED